MALEAGGGDRMKNESVPKLTSLSTEVMTLSGTLWPQV